MDLLLTSKIFQSVGLVFDVIGVFILAHGFKTVIVEEESPYGLLVNMGEELSNLKNEVRFGSIFLVIGFIFQIIGLWV